VDCDNDSKCFWIGDDDTGGREDRLFFAATLHNNKERTGLMREPA
jgi:hypothetical protein